MFVSTVTVYVNDVERALAFYIEKLGFEKRIDADMGEGVRWLTVVPPGEKTEIVLVAEGLADWTSERVGGNSGIILETGDLRAEVETLRERGVKITEEPVHHQWGWWAQFEDSEGNSFGFHSD